jgi:hypothetical protein
MKYAFSHGLITGPLGVVAAFFAAGVQSTCAIPINVAAGPTGGLTFVGQSFNETRAVDVTVLTSLDLYVSSMTLRDLDIGFATSALVGARIYNSNTTQLVASANATTSSGGTITVPLAATLASGGGYRVAIYVETSPEFQASARLYRPDPDGTGGFPYTEMLGKLRINSAHALADDAFPSNVNFGVPQIVLQVAEGPPSGNFDGDQDVDGVDFLKWQSNFGASPGATFAQGDANGDGAVNGEDFAVWNDQFGDSLQLQTIPEPAAGLLAVAGALLAWRHCRR